MTADPVEIVTDERWPAWRVLIRRDDDPDQPCGDALAPALLVDHRRGRAQLAENVFQPADGWRIETAYEQFSDPDRFEQYLRQQYGTTAIAWVDAPGTTVAIFDTAGYRRHVTTPVPPDLTAQQQDWRAWVNRDVYGLIVQRRVTGAPCPACGYDKPDDWVDIDDLWGFYGLTVARQSAQHLLQDHIT